MTFAAVPALLSLFLPFFSRNCITFFSFFEDEMLSSPLFPSPRTTSLPFTSPALFISTATCEIPAEQWSALPCQSTGHIWFAFVCVWFAWFFPQRKAGREAKAFKLIILHSLNADCTPAHEIGRKEFNNAGKRAFYCGQRGMEE